jgi:hypothetical protein
MTCTELRAHFEDKLFSGLASETCNAAVADHLAECLDCARFVETQKELASGLRRLRESAPRVSAALDSAVLTQYRDRSASSRDSRASVWARKPTIIALGWGAAVAAVVLVAIFLVPRQNSLNTQIQAKPPHLPIAPERVEKLQQAAVVPQASKRRKPRTVSRPQPREALSSTIAPVPLPDGFRSLMYCDELSCGGGMELVRVQLPLQPAGAVLGLQQVQNVVSADVLIGADGVARGIRIVQ